MIPVLRRTTAASSSSRCCRSFRTRSRLLDNPYHHDIPSFLKYANAVGLSHTRTTFQGTLYEYTVLKALQDLSPDFNLARVGGKGDLGIDLFGQWNFPHPPVTIGVQCKFSKFEGPSAVRDLIGAIVSRVTTSRQNTLGILACRGKFTLGIRQALINTRVPLAFMRVTPAELNDAEDGQMGGGVVQQFVWNRAAADSLLAGFGVTALYGEQMEPIIGTAEGEADEEPVDIPNRVILTFNGRPLSFPENTTLLTMP